MIRLKNIDVESDGMKRHSDTYLGDITASRLTQVFVAPIDCTVDRVDVFNSDSQAITTSPVVSLFIATATASLLAANHTASVSFGARIRFTPSANNSLTQGVRLAMSFNISGTSNFSAAIVHVRYTPNKYRSTF